MALKKQFELKTSTYEKNDNDKTKRISSLSNCLQEVNISYYILFTIALNQYSFFFFFDYLVG